MGLGALAVGGFVHTPAWAAAASDIYLIKTNYTASGMIEVHSAAVSSSYQGSESFVTWISASEKYNGVFQMVGLDLYFIKTRNTASGAVEVHNATRSSGYAAASVNATTLFGTQDAGNGTFQMVGSDLFFIKTKNTASRRVEVASATAASNYQQLGVNRHSYITMRDADRGVYQMVGQELFFIKTKYTGTRTIEIFSATAASNYRSIGVHTRTLISLREQDNGWFQMVGQDLYFIKTKNTASGRVEVLSATAESGYASVGVQSTTWLSTANGGDGWFLAIDPAYNTQVQAAPVPAPTTEQPPAPAPTSEQPPAPAPTTEQPPPPPAPTTEQPPAPAPTSEQPPPPAPTTEQPPAPAPTSEQPPPPPPAPTTEQPPAPAPTTEQPPPPPPITQAPPPVEAAPPGPATWEVAGVLLAKVQSYRASQGVARLGWNAALTEVAKSWAGSMARANRLSHNPYLDSQVPRGWSSLGENVAFTTKQGSAEQIAQALFSAWLGSWSHRSTMLSTKYNNSGLGVARSSNGTWYATQDLGRY